MKNYWVMMVAICAIAVGSNAYASPYGDYQPNGQLYAFNSDQIVNGATIQGGKWVMIKLRISGGKIMDYSFGGRDMVGNIIWETCYPTSYRQTHPGLDGNDICREYNYTATIYATNGSQMTVYF